MKTALVIYKKSLYEIYVQEKKNKHIQNLLNRGDVTTKDMLASHECNLMTIDLVVNTLEKLGFNVRTRYRGGPTMVKPEDIVFSVGGDGTFLWTQKYVPSGIPVFGVNSDPGRSVGYLCTATALDFEQRLKNYLLPDNQKVLGCPTNRTIQRLSLEINGDLVSSKILNDVLFCHKNPAAMSSYILNDEHQKSSGVWISTPVGSTGAMTSAGGISQPWHDTKLQYKVREPYQIPNKYKNRGGYFGNESLTIVSKMRQAIVAPDGSRDLTPVQMGDVVVIKKSFEPLTWVKV